MSAGKTSYDRMPEAQPPQYQPPAGAGPMMSQPQPMGYGQPPQQSGFHTTNTTVVVQQPTPVLVQQGMRDWNSGLCACFDDIGSCKLIPSY